MTIDPATMLHWLEVIVTIAAIGSTIVPLLYALAPWYKSRLGRIFMLQAVSLAIGVDLTAVFAFWYQPGIEVMFWSNAIVFSLIAISTFSLSWKIIKYDYTPYFKKPTEENPMTEPKTHPLISNATYDKLKFVVVIVLPAFAALYLSLAGLWNLPNAQQVAGTATAVNAFFGAVLLLSSRAYNNSEEKYDGTMEVVELEDGTRVASLNLKNYEDPADIVNQNEVVFKVN